MSTNDPPNRSPLGAYSDFWEHYLSWGVRVCPWWLDPILMGFYAGLFYLLAGSLRRGVLANVNVLFPRSSSIVNWCRGYRVFWNFACVAVDRIRASEDPGRIAWEIDGLDHFESLQNEKGGAIIATAHMGNYDMAGPVFAHRFNRTIHAVRAPERTESLQKAREQGFAETAVEGFRIVYNKPGSMLGISLVQALNRGEIVAVQADRVLFDVSPIEVRCEHHRLALPQGPFVLSQTTGCPIYPLFILRLGRSRYRIRVFPPFHCKREARDRRSDIRHAAEHWARLLGEVVRRHWYQWLVVEPILLPADRLPIENEF